MSKEEWSDRALGGRVRVRSPSLSHVRGEREERVGGGEKSREREGG